MWGMVLSRVGTFAAPWTHTHTHTPACPTWKDTARCGECCSDRVRTCAALGLTHRHTHTPTPFDWLDLCRPLDSLRHTHTPLLLLTDQTFATPWTHTHTPLLLASPRPLKGPSPRPPAETRAGRSTGVTASRAQPALGHHNPDLKLSHSPFHPHP